MLRIISQEIFNEAVQENKELLDLNAEEAIAETISQFKTQGVNLSNIIKEPFILDKENPVSVLVSKLQKTSDESEISLFVKELEILCEKGIEYKLLCGKEHVYNSLITKLSSDISLDLQEKIFHFFTIFMDGYPDILDEKGCLLFLEKFDSSPEIQKHIFKLVNITCWKHEMNRQMYMENNIAIIIEKILRQELSNELLCLVLNIIPALIRDDDIRSHTSKGYTHACSLGNELLKPLCHLLLDKKMNEPVLLECLLTALSSLIVNNDQCSIAEVEDCVSVVIKLLRQHNQNQKVMIKCFLFLFAVAGNDNLNVSMVRQGVAEQMVFAMDHYVTNKTMVQTLLKLASRLCLRKPNHGVLFFKLDFNALVIQAMRVHDKIGSVQVAGCWCIRNMSSRNPQHHGDYLALGAEAILNQVIAEHKLYAQDAKFALIELGCTVKLDEPWDGKEGDKLKR